MKRLTDKELSEMSEIDLAISVLRERREPTVNPNSLLNNKITRTIAYLLEIKDREEYVTKINIEWSLSEENDCLLLNGIDTYSGEVVEIVHLSVVFKEEWRKKQEDVLKILINNFEDIYNTHGGFIEDFLIDNGYCVESENV